MFVLNLPPGNEQTFLKKILYPHIYYRSKDGELQIFPHSVWAIKYDN